VVDLYLVLILPFAGGVRSVLHVIPASLKLAVRYCAHEQAQILMIEWADAALCDLSVWRNLGHYRFFALRLM
jgi:hypothetical protein